MEATVPPWEQGLPSRRRCMEATDGAVRDWMTMQALSFERHARLLVHNVYYVYACLASHAGYVLV